MKSSAYNYIFKRSNAEGYIVFNKFYGSIAVITQNLADYLSGMPVQVTTEEIMNCEENGFIVEDDMDEVEQGRKRFLESLHTQTSLNLIFETSQACNFGCLYCYQNSYRDPKIMSLDSVDLAAEYVEKILSKIENNIDTIKLNIIGGEPLLNKSLVNKILDVFAEISRRFNMHLVTKLDTNGSLLEDQIVSRFNRIVIAFSNADDQNTMRPLKNGGSSYLAVLENLKKAKYSFNQAGTHLSIRFNTNHQNYKYVKQVYMLIKGLGIDSFDMYLFNTINYHYNEEKFLFNNQLSDEEFKRINFDFLQYTFNHQQPVTDFPFPTFSCCQAYKPLNIKVTSTGQLALCDAFFTPLGNIKTLAENPDLHSDVFCEYQKFDPFIDPQCKTCQDIGICGGKYFCKETLENPCNFFPYPFNDYLEFFVENYEKHSELFILE